MKVGETDFFLGLCFFLSSLSKDKKQESCIVVKKRKIVSTGFSNINLLGSLEGSSEFIALSSIDNSLRNYEIYLDHTPSTVVTNYLSKFTPRKLTYFETTALCVEEAQLASFDFVRFHGNLNWMRDKVALMKSFDIFN
jgi:hypothetical protein